MWKEMCAMEYDEVPEAMAYAKRVEAAHRRVGLKSSRGNLLGGSSKA